MPNAAKKETYINYIKSGIIELWFDGQVIRRIKFDKRCKWKTTLKLWNSTIINLRDNENKKHLFFIQIIPE